MHRQKTLPLDGQESLEALWEWFPEEGRREVSCLYARLRLKFLWKVLRKPLVCIGKADRSDCCLLATV